jgi:hypothetical protein
MISVAVVILTTSGAINVLNYLGMLQRADAVLDIISDYNGQFPRSSVELEDRFKFPISSETPYQTRYFVILTDNSGNITEAKTGNIAGVGSGDLERLCTIVFPLQDGARGNIGDYRYLVRALDNNGKMLVFLDCSQSKEVMSRLISGSAIVSGIVVILIFGALVLISKKIIQPFVRNQEKQKQFITDAGHELKTPLAIIRTNAEVLEVCYGKNEWLDSIQHQTARLDGLVKGLLQLSRGSELENENEHIRFSLSSIVSDTAESFKTMAEQKGHKMHLSITRGIDYKGNAQSIGTLVSILTDNAIKYASENGEIYVSLSRMGKGTAKTAKLIVENDTDIDDSTDLNRFFERFYRSESSRSRQTGGYGIGLSVAKSITEAHKGKITVTKTGNKITFTVIL